MTWKDLSEKLQCSWTGLSFSNNQESFENVKIPGVENLAGLKELFGFCLDLHPYSKYLHSQNEMYSYFQSQKQLLMTVVLQISINLY